MEAGVEWEESGNDSWVFGQSSQKTVGVGIAANIFRRE